MQKNNSDPKKRRHLLRKIAIAIAAFISFVIANGALVAGLYWLGGVQLGFMSYSGDIVDTQKAQLYLGCGIADCVLLMYLLVFWLRKRKARFWRFMRIEVTILIPLYLISSIGGSTYLFIKGQHGGDYGCGQEVSLNQAYQATYPIYTDTGGGTAFAINSHGTLLTAYHVIKGAKTIAIGIDNPGSKLRVIKTNPKYDLALLQYNKPTPEYIPLTSVYNVTDQVYLIGWPDNVDVEGQPTITSGIISRYISSQDANNSGDPEPSGMSFIQTDAASNPGNSGGPLVDTCGAVGVMDASSENPDGSVEQGINYAISTAAVKTALGIK